MRVVLAAAIMPLMAAALAAQSGLQVAVLDQSNEPVSGVRIELKTGSLVVSSAETDPQGHAVFADLKPGRYEVIATKQGFELARKAGLDVSPEASNAVEFTLVPTIVHRDSVDVRGTSQAVDQGSAPPAELPTDAVKQLPSKPATVADALPLLPGVVR